MPTLRTRDAARPTRRRVARVLIAVYLLALALIAFWPQPVDRDLSDVLQAVTRALPWLSYEVIEFSANVLLFVPFGVLLALAAPRLRAFVVPIGLAASVVIELGQAVLLSERTPSLLDVVANTAGAAIGLGLVLVIERFRAP
ncbi:hypothetical protein Microterr_04300 [Microbacterium terricola]|uniref:VanZ-like domain-containing protein n=1 Tax=Microbacterium terricola TaxID=344163 RepID=A0ABM8DW77_9MICO|nr:hypothetical protein Microterr_04300 [Microbacterium terricola]